MGHQSENRIMAMKEALIACLVVALGAASAEVPGGQGNGQPLKYINSCEIDLNGDSESDVALLVETVRGRELIVLLKTVAGYNSFVPGTPPVGWAKQFWAEI